MRLTGFVRPIFSDDRPDLEVDPCFIQIDLTAEKDAMGVHVDGKHLGGPREWTIRAGWSGAGVFVAEGDMLYRLTPAGQSLWPGDQLILNF